MSRRRLGWSAVVGLLLGFGSEAAAQRPAGAKAAGHSAAAADSSFAVASLVLSRNEVQKVAAEIAAADKSRPDAGLLAGIKKTVSGDKHQVEAAKRILGQQARSLASGGRTVVVVIGSGVDSARVQESLAGVKRKVTLAFVNRDFSDGASDNTVLKGGLTGAVLDQGSNLWVYLPKAGSGKPDHTLSTRVATATMWNGLFATAGDAIDVNQLHSALSRPAASTPADTAAAGPQAAPPNPAAPPPAAGLSVGDVVVPKIANVKVLAQPSADANVLGTVGKTDELVVTGAEQNGFIEVEGSSTAGWVRAALVAKR